ncbi:hypothetical protein F5Y03DRAFT_101455 [Xylaria venustula]|nr:hypothetical protein F5Y03DRAFT_101455 [Xylaria venustula]
MAQRVATPQGTKRRFSGFSSPPGLHMEEPETRRPPYPPPGSMGGLQAPQVGVAVVTIDMFREFQRQVALNFERQNSQITLLQERVQSIEGRIQSLEDAEDMAIDAVREIRDGVIPRVEQHHESLDSLTAAVTHQTNIIDAWGNLGQEFRANQGRDPVRPSPLTWRPGPLGGPTDQAKNAIEDLKTQITRSFASLAEHDRRLGEIDAHLGTHDRHLTDHERRVGEHDTRLSGHDRHLGDHNTRFGALDRLFAEQNARLAVHEGHLRDHDVCVAKHTDRMGALDKANEQLNGRIAVIEQRTDHGLSPAQITAIMQNHQQRLESLEQTLQHHIKASQEAQAAKPSSPQSQSHSVTGERETPLRQIAPENHKHTDQQGNASEESQKPELNGKKIQRPTEETNSTLELKRLEECLDAIDKRMIPLEQRLIPLEQRMDSVEKECEKLSQSATTPEGVAKEAILEEEGQFPAAHAAFLGKG